MTLLEKNEFVEIYLHNDIKAFEQRFLKPSSDLFGEKYIDQMKLFGNVITQQLNAGINFPNLIINTTQGGPTMEPLVQDWMHSVFYPFLEEKKITTKAYCLGEEILSKLSVELTADDKSNSPFKYDFFATLKEGMEWLKAQNAIT